MHTLAAWKQPTRRKEEHDEQQVERQAGPQAGQQAQAARDRKPAAQARGHKPEVKADTKPAATPKPKVQTLAVTDKREGKGEIHNVAPFTIPKKFRIGKASRGSQLGAHLIDAETGRTLCNVDATAWQNEVAAESVTCPWCVMRIQHVEADHIPTGEVAKPEPAKAEDKPAEEEAPAEEVTDEAAALAEKV